MLRKGNIQAACFLMTCMLFCSCAKADRTILIGGEQSQGTESQAVESIGEQDPMRSGVTQNPEEEGQETEIRVYVCGAVKHSRVVEIPAGSRAEDALLAAGGFTEEAAQEAVNLAEWVTDGQMLYFPTREEAAELESQTAQAQEGLININTADTAALCTLPGVGESRAADIIAYREANGGFESCEDIMKVPGIKTAMYEKIKDKITVK